MLQSNKYDSVASSTLLFVLLVLRVAAFQHAVEVGIGPFFLELRTTLCGRGRVGEIIIGLVVGLVHLLHVLDCRNQVLIVRMIATRVSKQFLQREIIAGQATTRLF